LAGEGEGEGLLIALLISSRSLAGDWREGGREGGRKLISSRSLAGDCGREGGREGGRGRGLRRGG